MVKLTLVAAAGLSTVFVVSASAQQAPTCEGPKDACQQIADLSKVYDTAFNNHDVATIVGGFTPDATDVGEGVMLSGREALEKFYSDGFKAGWSNHSSGPTEVHVMGDWAWAVGTWSGLPPGAKDKVQGTWGAVDIRQGGAWKIRMLTWNVAEPAPQQAAQTQTK
jgi:ketosteroid isomerase-like protein